MIFRKTAVFVLAVLLFGCRTAPVPSEVLEADLQEKDLWRAGASLFAGQDHAAYLQSLKSARRILDAENLKLGWFRDYGRVRRDFEAALSVGKALKSKVRSLVAMKTSSIAETAAAVRRRLRTLDGLTLSLVERGEARKQLAQASILLSEADGLTKQAKFDEAAAKLDSASSLAAEAEQSVVSYISRYLDPAQVRAWKNAADETIADSRKRGVTALIVSKLERRLSVYKNGEIVRTYDVGLGFNGLADKRHAGDNATPEGRYTIVRKIPASQYYKALLINYPNDEDRKWFAQEKAKGNIPRWVGIGGDVEIHGGGEDTLTRGCVSLDNDKMDELYALVSVGTPITIIGTMELENYVIKAIRDN
ncbi:MAG: L,D-transpeptidase [Acidobacteria bacterium]|nr:L,D-transpeptidase [Acidobacteriota bacterium]